jgi:hypothetical protein
LDFSIPTDLFSQYIDANFPSATDDNSKATFHNVDDVFASHECDADHESCNGETKPVSSCGDTTETDPTSSGLVEKELSSDVTETDASSAVEQEVTDDILDAVDMEIETEEMNPTVLEVTSVVNDLSKPGIQ